jgi:hypothetical protein
MWLIKGIFLGTGLFVIGFFVYGIAFAHRIGVGWNSAIAPADVLKAVTVRNPFFWLAFAGALMVGCSMARGWPVRFDAAKLLHVASQPQSTVSPDQKHKLD